ncbi:MAG: GntR family transcriptional regulator [Verrucomicrobia bacterium]|nr:GntR family transcriptional regulator [Verrucomicrobiota bacterium]
MKSAAMADILKRHLLRDQIRDHLLDRIGSGALAPGNRIVEARVCEELGVSSIPVREAIRELVTMGVLAAATHKGAWVREVSLDETVEALQVKSALDALAARLAAPKLKGNCAELRRLYEDIKKAARRRDFVTYQQCNQAFHRHIVETAGNAALLRSWSSLAFEVRTRFIMDFLANGDAVGIAFEHEPIVEAFEEGKTECAAKLLASHSNNLVAYLRRLRVTPEKEPQPTHSAKSKEHQNK